MNTKINWTQTLSVVAGIVILWLIIDNDNKRKKIAELKEALKSNDILTNDLKEKLQDLIKNNPEIDSKIANELAQIAALIEIKQETKAILSLAKIIENLLKELYKNNSDFKDSLKAKKRNKASFEDYLEYAREKGVIPKEEYHLIALLKIIRNQEAHELDVKKEKGKVIACFVSGLSITLGLCKMLKKAA